MIKIALVSHAPALAGAERMLYNLAVLLRDDPRFDATIYVPAAPGSASELKELCDAEHIAAVWTGENCGYKTWYLWGKYGERDGAKARATLQGVETLSKQLTRDGIDLVLCNTAVSMIPALAAANLGLPIVTWVHGVMDNVSLPIEYDAQQRLLYDRILLSLSSEVMCCSDWTTNFYKGLSLGSIQTVYNWTAAREGKKGKDGAQAADGTGKTEVFRFVCLNTFEGHKGLFTLLKAANRLKKRGVRNFAIDLYGDGAKEFKESLKEYVRSHKLEKYITFRGRTINIEAVYENSFCLLQPSRLEPFGMTIIEAMCHSRPVIATKAGGPSEIVLDGETGYLVERDDAEAMAEKMIYLMDHPDIAMAMGEAGRKRYQDCFSEEVAKDRIVPILERAYQTYNGISGHQQLILDMALHQLEADAWGVMELPSGCAQGIAESYDPEDLCFSGVLRGSRKYGVTGREGQIRGIGILVADLSGTPAQGSLTLNLYQSGKQLTSVTLPGSGLNMNGWTYFRTMPVHIDDGLLTVEICPEGFESLGVFELHSKRGFIYKVFNKLGHPLKGRDVLKVSFIQ